MKWVGEVCAVPEGSYILLGGGGLLKNVGGENIHHVSMKKGVDVCVVPEGIYVAIVGVYCLKMVKSSLNVASKEGG